MARRKSGSPRKKVTKAPRIATRLPADAQQLLLRCLAIWAAMKGDPQRFSNPNPLPSEIDLALQELTDALKAAENPSPSATTAVQAAADKVRHLFNRLAMYVESVVRASPAEDAHAIITSVLLHESNAGKRPPKPALEARQGQGSGAAELIALAVALGVTYFWEYSADRETWTALQPTPRARTSLSGLTPGKVYYFRFHVLMQDGSMGDPSQIVSLMVV